MAASPSRATEHLGTPVAFPLIPPFGVGRYGEAIAGLDDLNDDGVEDLAVGSPGSGINQRVFVFSGADRHVIRTLREESPDGFGSAIARIPDLDGDGADEIAVGAPGPFEGAHPPPPVCLLPPCDEFPLPVDFGGAVFVYSGRSGARLMLLRHPWSGLFDDAFGAGLTAPGDLNRNGTVDLVVNYHAGLIAFDGNGMRLWESDMGAPRFGLDWRMPLASIGDVNSDGIGDVLAGDPTAVGSGIVRGLVWVISGADGRVLRAHNPSVAQDFEQFGRAVAGVGDQTGDGIGDYVALLVRSQVLDLFDGARGVWLRRIGIVPAGSSCEDFSVAGAEDADGDGVQEMWIGCVRPGRGYGHLRLQTTMGVPLASFDGGPDFGGIVAQSGNVGGTRRPDVIVGAPAGGAAFVVVLSFPDLVVSDLAIHVDQNGCPLIRAAVTNQGDIAAPSVAVQFTAGDVASEVSSQKEISPGAAVVVEVSVATPKTDGLEVSALVDPRNAVPELDENNNARKAFVETVPDCV
jgi:hypothetical protein